MLFQVPAGGGVGNLFADGVLFLAGEIIHAPASGGVLEAFQEQRTGKQRAVTLLAIGICFTAGWGQLNFRELQINAGGIAAAANLTDKAAGGFGNTRITGGCYHIRQSQCHIVANSENQQRGNSHGVVGQVGIDPDAVQRYAGDVQHGIFDIFYVTGIEPALNVSAHQCAIFAVQAANGARQRHIIHGQNGTVGCNAGEDTGVHSGVLALAVGGLLVICLCVFQLLEREGNVGILNAGTLEHHGIERVAAEVNGAGNFAPVSFLEEAGDGGFSAADCASLGAVSALVVGTPQHHFFRGIDDAVIVRHPGQDGIQVVIIPGAGIFPVLGKLVFVGVAAVLVNERCILGGNGHNAVAPTAGIINGAPHQLVKIAAAAGDAHRDTRLDFVSTMRHFQIQALIAAHILVGAADAHQQAAGGFGIGLTADGCRLEVNVLYRPVSCALINQAAEFGVGGELGTVNHHAAERGVVAVQLIAQQTAGGFLAAGLEVGADSQSVDVQLLAVPEAAEQTAHCCLIALAYGVLDGSADMAICDGDAGLFIFVKEAVCNEAAQPTHAAVSTGVVHQTARPGAVGEIEFIVDRGNGDEAGQIGVVCPAAQPPGNTGLGACDGGGTEHLTHNAAMDGGTLPIGAEDFAAACDGQIL